MNIIIFNFLIDITTSSLIWGIFKVRWNTVLLLQHHLLTDYEAFFALEALAVLYTFSELAAEFPHHGHSTLYKIIKQNLGYTAKMKEKNSRFLTAHRIVPTLQRLLLLALETTARWIFWNRREIQERCSDGELPSRRVKKAVTVLRKILRSLQRLCKVN